MGTEQSYTKTCRRCEKQFETTNEGTRFCGSREDKTGCAWTRISETLKKRQSKQKAKARRIAKSVFEPEFKVGAKVMIKKDSEYADQSSAVGTIMGEPDSAEYMLVEFRGGYENSYREKDLNLYPLKKRRKKYKIYTKPKEEVKTPKTRGLVLKAGDYTGTIFLENDTEITEITKAGFELKGVEGIIFSRELLK